MMGDLGRLHPNIVVHMNVVNQSMRANGTNIELIVLHDTESHNRAENSDLASIGEWFNNPIAQASSHVCTNGDGNSGIYVSSRHKAWHVAHYNSPALGIEQIGFSVEGRLAWEQRPLELLETARWVARWSLMYGIPIQHGAVSYGSVDKPGVITHRELGILGGGHNDPGPDYPFDHVLSLANRFKQEQYRYYSALNK